MIRRFLHSKIHRATVTETDLEYVGSLTLDLLLMEAANILPHEQVEVYNITNGQRFKTYAIVGEPGKGEVCVNGAAAHLAEVGDKVIVVTYCDLNKEEMDTFTPTIITVDDSNKIV
jgi:aspartate 1-decarboxylase